MPPTPPSSERDSDDTQQSVARERARYQKEGDEQEAQRDYDGERCRGHG